MPRPELLGGDTKLYKVGCGNVYVTINDDEEGKPFEVFVTAGKSGGCASAQNEAIGRVVSLYLQTCDGTNTAINKVIKQLVGIECHESKKPKALSCADVIGKRLREILKERNKEEEPVVATVVEETIK